MIFDAFHVTLYYCFVYIANQTLWVFHTLVVGVCKSAEGCGIWMGDGKALGVIV